jgi:hypothetical protein
MFFTVNQNHPSSLHINVVKTDMFAVRMKKILARNLPTYISF